MLRVVVAVALACWAWPAAAAEELLKGPAPAWTTAVEVAAPPLEDEGPPLRAVLLDYQARADADGVAHFVRQLFQVRDSSALGALGSVSISWDPALDTVTLHSLRIIRGGEVIDVLSRQDFTVIRRESNLERAVLDGVLTATVQPEGMQVGDVLELAYTSVRADPVLRGRAEGGVFAPVEGIADRVRLRLSWPRSRALRWKASSGLSRPAVREGGAEAEVVIDMRDVAPPKATDGAPARFYPSRELSFTEFRSWTEASALMAPLYRKAAVLDADSPLKREAARIRAASNDPATQAAAALKLVQDKVRYLALTLDQGGYVPASADESWRRRYGDCKAKTVLLLALLGELGIQAEPVLVSTDGDDGLDQELPGLRVFDHVIVRAMLDGKAYWLDGTRIGDGPLADIPAPPYLWVLPLREGDATLEPVPQRPLDRPAVATHIAIDVSDGLDAPARIRASQTFTGDLAIFSRLNLAGMTASERDAALRELWEHFEWVDIKSVSTSEDRASGGFTAHMEGQGPLVWDEHPGGARRLRISAAEFTVGEYARAADAPLPDAPYLVDGHPFHVATTVEVTLPYGGRGFMLDAPAVAAEAGGLAFSREGHLRDGVAVIRSSERSLVRELPAADAKAANDALAALAEVEVAVRTVGGYAATDKDIAAWGQQTPETATEFLQRGARFLDVGRNDLAFADFDRGVELEPDSSYAYANRGLAHIRLGRPEAAKADLSKAQQLDSRNFVALHGLGLLAIDEGRFADAAAAFGRAADLKPGNAWAHRARIDAFLAMGAFDLALAEAAEVEKFQPGVPAHMLRYRIFAAQNRHEEALGELDKALAQIPDEPSLHATRAFALARQGKTEAADAALERALALEPTSAAHLARARMREWAPAAERLADVDAADRLEPGSPDATLLRAHILSQGGRHDEAIAILTQGLKAWPDKTFFLVLRAETYVRAGRGGEARADFARVRAKAKGNAAALNELCWAQATSAFALDQALADCDAALALAPRSAAIIDSRALVLLRMNRPSEAKAAYDEAIRLRPNQSASLFGRGIAQLRLGHEAEGRADLDKARASDARIEATFSQYGVTPPTR